MTTRRDIITSGLGLAGIIAAGRAPAALVRSMVAARAAAMGGGGKKPDPYHGYVANGLVICCDGEDGWTDTHWQDLTGNTDGFVMNNCVREGNHLLITAEAGATLGFNQTVYSECSGDYTFEVELDVNNAEDYKKFFGFHGNYMNMAKWSSGQVLCQFGSNVWMYSLRCLATMVMRRNDQSCDTYCNGVFVATTNPSTSAFVSSQMRNLGVSGANAKFRAYRIYNRVLTPQEIAKNSDNYLTKEW